MNRIDRYVSPVPSDVRPGTFALAALPALLLGAYLVRLGLFGRPAGAEHWFKYRPTSTPPWIQCLIGGLLVAVYAFVAAPFLRRLVRAATREPWRRDHSWDPRGTWPIPASGEREQRNALFAAAFVLLALAAPFNYLLFADDSPPISRRSQILGVSVKFPLVAFFDAIALAVVVGAARSRLAARGRARRLFFDSPPFVPGGEVSVHLFERSPNERIVGDLTCVEERFEKGSLVGILRHQNAVDAAPADESGLRRLRMAVPADAPSSHLDADPAKTGRIYWELRVSGDRYLVPVYGGANGRT